LRGLLDGDADEHDARYPAGWTPPPAVLLVEVVRLRELLPEPPVS
jgi:hypothetical protein